MKKRMRIICLALAFTFMLSLCSVFAVDNQSEDTSMDALDVFLVADRYLSGLEDSNGEALWSEDTRVEKIVPLYDTSDNLFAYYITFSPSGYAVVNNNLNNPVAIEFGDGSNESIEAALAAPVALSSESDHIVYLGLTSIRQSDMAAAAEGDIALAQTDAEEPIAFYEQFDETDAGASELHARRRAAYLEQAVMPLGSSDPNENYGFYLIGDLPTSGAGIGSITGINGMTWAVTSTYNSIAKRHCCAVAATNLAMYWAKRVDSRLKKNNSESATFEDLYGRIGPGPKVDLTSRLSAYVKDVTSGTRTLTATSLTTNYNNIMGAVQRNHPCALLLMANVADWHWVVAVGYRTYSESARADYVQIASGWRSTADRYYHYNVISSCTTLIEYSVS